MHRYITTLDELREVWYGTVQPYLKADKNNILGVDLETYLTSMLGYLDEEASAAGEEEEDEEESGDTLEAQFAKAVANIANPKPTKSPVALLEKKKKGKKLIPRPLKLKDGTFTGHIRTIAVGLDPDNILSSGGIQFVIDVMKIGYDAVASVIKEDLETALILGHNLKYDYQFLVALMNIRLRRMIDTMLADKVRCNGLEKGFSLGDCYDRHIDIAWFQATIGMDFKEYKKFKKQNQEEESWAIPVLKDTQIEYAAQDVWLIFYVWASIKTHIQFYVDTFETDIDSRRGIRSVIQLECSLIPVISMTELRGVKIDFDNHFKVIKLLEENLQEALKVLPFETRKVMKLEKRTKGKGDAKVTYYKEKWVDVPFNIGSYQHVRLALYNLLKEFAISTKITTKWNKVGKTAIAEGKNPKEVEGALESNDKYFITLHLKNEEREWDEEIELNSQEATIKRFYYEDEITDHLSEDLKKIIYDLLTAKQAKSLLAKFGLKVINACTDRKYLYAYFNQLGTESGRMSSSGSMNLQQIIAKGVLKGTEIKLASLFRASFCAEYEDPNDEWVLVVADYAQIQARLASLYCGDYRLIKSFSTGEFDIHGDVAMSILKLNAPAKKGTEERELIGKTFGFSALFGAYPKKIRTWMRDKTDGRINWKLEQAVQARQRFFDSYPEFLRAREDYAVKVETLTRQANNNVYPFRFKKYENRSIPFHVARTMGTNYIRPRGFAIPSDWNRLSESQLSKFYKPTEFERSSNGIRFGNFFSKQMDRATGEGFNHEIQGAEANMLKVAARSIHNKALAAGIPEDEGAVIYNHDEIVIHCRKKNSLYFKNLLETEMVAAADEVGIEGIAIKAEAKIGKTWYDAK